MQIFLEARSIRFPIYSNTLIKALEGGSPISNINTKRAPKPYFGSALPGSGRQAAAPAASTRDTERRRRVRVRGAACRCRTRTAQRTLWPRYTRRMRSDTRRARDGQCVIARATRLPDWLKWHHLARPSPPTCSPGTLISAAAHNPGATAMLEMLPLQHQPLVLLLEALRQEPTPQVAAHANNWRC